MARQPKRTALLPKAAPRTVIEIPRRDFRTITITIEGETPLITNNWSESSIKDIGDKQGKIGRVKSARDPKREYEESIYRLRDGGFAMKSGAIKKAMIDAARYVEGITMTLATGAFHILPGDLLPLKSAKPVMRTDAVVLRGRGGSVGSLAYRAEFADWSLTFRIKYDAGVISAAQLMQLLDSAGFSVGIGAWRPQCKGSFGMFHVAGADAATLAAD